MSLVDQKIKNLHNAKIKKGSENRVKSGARERNVVHPNGEEHSRVPKGNKGIRRIEASLTLTSISAAIIFIVANDVTVVELTTC